MNRRQFVGALFAASAIDGTPTLAHATSSSDPAITNLSRIPYSIAGSWLVVGASDQGVALKTVRRSAVSYRWQQAGPWADMLLEVAMLIGSEETPCTIDTSTSAVTLRHGNSSIELIFADQQTVLFTATACGIRLLLSHPAAWIDGTRPGILRAYDQQSKTYLELQSAQPLHVLPFGTAASDSITLKDRATQSLTVRCTTREMNTRIPPSPFAAEPVRKQRNDELALWMNDCPSAPERYQPAAQTAWYLFFALQVSPEGQLHRQTVLSSKRSMNMIWSWDNCLNALALVHARPALAWDQLRTILDHQQPSGVLPDAISESEIIFGFNKPPIWAWTIQRLLPATPSHDRRDLLEEIYPKIVLFHQWWLRERDLLGDGLPCYMSGNDSGWDNASIFADRWPVQSPDLATWLILDAEGLAEIALELGRMEEATRWQTHAADLLDRFHKRFWIDGQPHYFSLPPSGPVRKSSTSLITSLPLLLGNRLDPAVRKSLIHSLSDPSIFFAPSGPATEALNSPMYEANGYWRGPVWGISTYLICTALFESGEAALAQTLATRFCDTCASDGDFRENYDARTGVGQYDSGMTWTAADFLLLANRFMPQ
jgi:putative isomerase